ncbi:MAG: cobalt ECF transporter T component CbiQ [Magnetospirillum sp.]|nr:cobalt ECF transporter T component CbiQ [Magnetospirillum sp.]
MASIDRLAQTSPWRTLPLAEKALLALGLLLLALVLPPWPGGAIVLAVAAATAIGLAGIPAAQWLAIFAAPFGFVLTGAATLALGWDSGGFRFLPDGAVAALAMVLRSAAAVSSLLLLSLTTPATDFVRGAQRLGLPPELAETALATYGFLFILQDTATAMHASQAARLGYDGPGRALRSLGGLAAALLPRAFERARRLETGLAARGFDGRLRVLAAARTISPIRVSAILATLASVAGTGLWAAWR